MGLVNNVRINSINKIKMSTTTSPRVVSSNSGKNVEDNNNKIKKRTFDVAFLTGQNDRDSSPQNGKKSTSIGSGSSSSTTSSGSEEPEKLIKNSDSPSFESRDSSFLPLNLKGQRFESIPEDFQLSRLESSTIRRIIDINTSESIKLKENLQFLSPHFNQGSSSVHHQIPPTSSSAFYPAQNPYHHHHHHQLEHFPGFALVPKFPSAFPQPSSSNLFILPQSHPHPHGNSNGKLENKNNYKESSAHSAFNPFGNLRPPFLSPQPTTTTSGGVGHQQQLSTTPPHDYSQHQQHQQQQQQQKSVICPTISNPTTLLPPSLTSLTLPAQNVCAKCNIGFRMTSDLVYHMRSQHKRDSADPMKKKREDKLKCPVCHETFRERHHLTRHMTAHLDRESEAGLTLNDLK